MATINVLYFASLRETLGRGAETLELPEGVANLGDLKAYLVARGGNWAALGTSKNLKMALNQTMATATAPIKAGDEVAFFPPVTGG